MGVAVLANACLLSPASAEEALPAWFSQETATGDWGGLRAEIEKAGVTPALNFTTDLMTNPVGGISQSAAYAGAWTLTFDVDLEVLAGIEGLSAFVSASSEQGRDLSAEDIGNLFDVAQVFNGDGLRLNQAYLRQELFDQALTVTLGRLASGDVFAVLDSYQYYVSGAVNDNPTSILINVPSFTTPPFAEWGTSVTLTPGEAFYASAGVYNANPEAEAPDKYGADFRLGPGGGFLTLAEVGYTPDKGLTKGGLPGRYALGGYYDTSNYAELDDLSRKEKGNYGIYLLGEQLVHRQEEGSDRGLTAWTTLTFGPDQSINPVPFAAYGGAYYKGLSAGRPDDIAAFALYYGLFSDRLDDQSYELALEANYRFQYAPWLYVTPDIQYVINPAGEGIPNALVFGMEISIDF